MTEVQFIYNIISIASIALLVYEVNSYKKSEKTIKREVSKIKKEYGRIYEANKSLKTAIEAEPSNVLQKIINELEQELQSLNGVVVGSVEYYRRDQLRGTVKILRERLENE